MNGLDIFAGIGGFSFALSDWVLPKAYVEIEPFCQSVLVDRMLDGMLPVAPIWDDVQTLTAKELQNIDIIYGGFPCQDISVAGNGSGLAGKRSGLFFEVVRLAKEIKPTFLFLENVPAIRTRGLEQVVRELANAGYDCRWCCLSAAEVGALHKRNRWFLLAYLSNPDSTRLEVMQQGQKKECAPFVGTHRWSAEPDVGRVAYGIPARVNRIKALGNAVVPAQVKEAFKYLIGIK
jgi:DNA (cytosine-5)-methyltransferase 1